MNDKLFEVTDNCGGISETDLKKEVFRFGFSDISQRKSTIGFYGIGLKRALFKIGKDITFETDDGRHYNRLDINVDNWVADRENWDLPLHPSSGKSKLKSGTKPFTKIRIVNLSDEAKETFTPTFVSNLKETISIYYTRIIQNQINFHVNGQRIQPFDLKIRYDREFAPANLRDEYEGVKIQITCWMERHEEGRQKKERGRQGWNVFMNNRLVIHDDASPKTAWSGEEGQLPKMHPIYNQFRGLVLLTSEDPSLLPINTLKNDFHTESKTYHYLLKKMVKTARPLVNFLSTKYEKLDERESQALERVAATESKAPMKVVTVDQLRENHLFKAVGAIRLRDDLTVISYKKPRERVSKVKKYLKLSNNAEVGSETFDYFVKVEGLDDEK
jgi:hypothetical protein